MKKFIFFLFFSTVLTGCGISTITSQSKQPTQERVIELTAKRWQYSPSIITVKKGEKVKIVVNNTDTTHGISIPDYAVAGVKEVSFVASQIGEFPFLCPTVCGEDHEHMRGKIVVEE